MFFFSSCDSDFILFCQPAHPGIRLDRTQNGPDHMVSYTRRYGLMVSRESVKNNAVLQVHMV